LILAPPNARGALLRWSLLVVPVDMLLGAFCAEEASIGACLAVGGDSEPLATDFAVF
jgi:hypothetical protein